MEIFSRVVRVGIDLPTGYRSLGNEISLFSEKRKNEGCREVVKVRHMLCFALFENAAHVSALNLKTFS